MSESLTGCVRRSHASPHLPTIDQRYLSCSRVRGIIHAYYTFTSLTGSRAMPKLDKQDQRIANVFGTQDVPDVDTETLEQYLAHLTQHLALPCQLTGIEDFDWEEYYVIGPGSKAEHERLRKTRPSYMDTYELLSFDSILKFFQVDITGMFRMTSRVR